MNKSNRLQFVLSIILVLTMCLPLGLVAAAQEELSTDTAVNYDAKDIENIQYAKVTTNQGSLNMRAEPKAKGKVLHKLANGSAVQVISHVDTQWTQVYYKGDTGYVMSKFIEEITLGYDYDPIEKGDKGATLTAFQQGLSKLGYLKTDHVGRSFDNYTQKALVKLQLVNDLPLNPEVITPQVQALMEWKMLTKGKSGYADVVVDEDSGLTAAIFCWDEGGRLYEADQAVKVKINYAVNAAGGTPPYSIKVAKSLTSPERGGVNYSDDVPNPFHHIWKKDTQTLYIYATVVDAGGNRVTACAPFAFTLPDRYTDDGEG